MSRRRDDSGTLGLNLLFAPSTGIGKRSRILGMKRGKTDRKSGGKERSIVHVWVEFEVDIGVISLLDHYSLRSDLLSLSNLFIFPRLTGVGFAVFAGTTKS